MKREDRFKIRRKKETSFRFSMSHAYIILLSVYILSLFFLPLGRNTPEPTYILKSKISSLCVLKDRIYVASGKMILSIDGSFKREFPFYVLKMERLNDKIVIITDRVYVLDSSLNIVREFFKEKMFPEEIYTFKSNFGIKWRSKKTIDIAFSRYSIEPLKEVDYLDLKNTKTNVFASMFFNGERIILFENSGNVAVFNFNGEIIWNKNIRINESIVFHPLGLFDEDRKLMILYWKESIGGKTLLYLLNYDGDIIVKEEIRNGVNGAFLYQGNLYILTKDSVLVRDHKSGEKVIPFYSPIYGKSMNGNTVIVWKIDVDIYKHLLIDINNKKRFFMEGIDGVRITEDGVYIFKGSYIYAFYLKE